MQTGASTPFQTGIGMLLLFKSNANKCTISLLSLPIAANCWLLNFVISASSRSQTDPSSPSTPPFLLTFFTHGWLLSPSFFFFSIAACVCDEVASVWFEALSTEGTSSFKVRSFHRLPLLSLPLFSLCFPTIQPKLVQPCASKHNAMDCFPFPSFIPSLSPSLLPLYSCLIVDCSRDWVPWIAGIKTEAKLCVCWPKMVMMWQYSDWVLKKWWKTTEYEIYCSKSRVGLYGITKMHPKLEHKMLSKQMSIQKLPEFLPMMKTQHSVRL